MNSPNASYVSMGKPVKAPCLIPVRHSATPCCINQPFMVDGKAYRVTCVSFGTPHGVVIVDDVENTDIERLGEPLSSHALFPKGASIVFVQPVNSGEIKARIWQRGGGEAPFTPEGVCAAATASKMLQKTGREAAVLVGGERFHVKWDSADDNVYYSRLPSLAADFA